MSENPDIAPATDDDPTRSDDGVQEVSPFTMFRDENDIFDFRPQPVNDEPEPEEVPKEVPSPPSLQKMPT